MIMRAIDPEAEILPTAKGESGLRTCASCGCAEDAGYIKKSLLNMLTTNAGHESYRLTGSMDINDLLDSYMFENLTSSESIDDCLRKIAESTHLLRPCERYYLCLEENWHDSDRCTVKGYSDTMRLAIEAQSEGSSENIIKTYSLGSSEEHNFDVSLMLPQLYEERDHTCVFFFAPMHFRESTMGYSVLQCRVGQRKIDTVFRNWLRNVNNALEMTRAQQRLTVFSERDAMTGLYNRRGMESHIKSLMANASFHDSWLVFVIDMDGLKHINDTYGHTEGDYGISAVASAVRQIARSSEICVRAGGDEFYVIGLGDYKNIDAIIRIEKFKEALAEENKAKKPYEISASIGFCCEPYNPLVNVNDIINLSDSRMYENKVARKKAR